ncbi:hypothetical protein EMIHUDRAFT_205365 [Emiliania huxleyi CCMP1516]|uniref:Uncharacterized protein n=2 Tax=Emiliania huxleyi TaxID=2903 RepID=A0A0D3JS79_EMIH1|nr:hypothetical protein EMIHUDRAFT_205365 [Emiliania huxleyi CCMP1516]EOD26364.1 hypothetical protein EMIHUDRAFT_205365 [Emiliania huxleyi CCMP1516]|eukprot:XP_005778793.1 hypothetical protein EMIHUDRAFT_205365 [Emiliania huxleyi CCMP1516]
MATSVVQVAGKDFDLSEVLGLNAHGLHAMLRACAEGLCAAQASTKELRAELAAVRKAADERTANLEAALSDTKVAGSSLADLQSAQAEAASAAETMRQQIGALGASVEQRLAYGGQVLEAKLQSIVCDLSELRATLSQKLSRDALDQSLQSLEERLGALATGEALVECEHRLTERFNQASAASIERAEKQAASAEAAAARMTRLEQESLPRLRRELHEEIRSAEWRSNLTKQMKALSAASDARFAETTRVSESLERRLTQLGEQLAEARSESSETHVAMRKLRSDSKAAWERAASAEGRVAERLERAESALGSHGTELEKLRKEATRQDQLRLEQHEASLEACEEARLIAGSALDKTEALRVEAAGRLQMLRQRLTRAEKEMLRQLEESAPLDSPDAYAELSQRIDTKADVDATERWLEATQQLGAEVTAMHARTATLSNGLKVLMRWVEGMADRVTGVQGTQHSLQSALAATREEVSHNAEVAHASAQGVAGHLRALLATMDADARSRSATRDGYFSPHSAGPPKTTQQFPPSPAAASPRAWSRAQTALKEAARLPAEPMGGGGASAVATGPVAGRTAPPTPRGTSAAATSQGTGGAGHAITVTAT